MGIPSVRLSVWGIHSKGKSNDVYNASFKTDTSSGIAYHRQLPHLPRKVFPSFTD